MGDRYELEPGVDPGEADFARRTALTALLAAVAAASGMGAGMFGGAAHAQPAPAAARLDPARFLEMSRRLTAQPIRSRSLANEIQAAIGPLDVGDNLGRLADLVERSTPEQLGRAIAEAGYTGLADMIVVAWYSGTVGGDKDLRIVTHSDALAWAATGYAKAPGTCDTAFGAWTAQPVIAAAKGARR